MAFLQLAGCVVLLQSGCVWSTVVGRHRNVHAVSVAILEVFLSCERL